MFHMKCFLLIAFQHNILKTAVPWTHGDKVNMHDLLRRRLERLLNVFHFQYMSLEQTYRYNVALFI